MLMNPLKNTKLVQIKPNPEAIMASLGDPSLSLSYKAKINITKLAP